MKKINFSGPDLVLLGLSVVLLLTILFQIRRGWKDTDYSIHRFRLIFTEYLLIIALICHLSTKDFFSSSDTFPTRLALIFGITLFFTFLILFSKIDKGLGFLKRIPPHFLIYIQVFRIMIEVILYMFWQQRIVPKELTMAGRNFDVFIGCTAFVAGYLVHTRKSFLAGIIWNIFGLISIGNIIFIAMASFPSSFRVYETNYLHTYFPGILIPAFLAPLAAYFHIFSLKQLLYLRKEEETPEEKTEIA